MADEELDRFAAYYAQGDELVKRATKEEIAEAGRLLAMHVAYYHGRYGAVPDDEVLRAMAAGSLAETDVAQLTMSAAMFAKTLGMVLSGDDTDASTH